MKALKAFLLEELISIIEHKAFADIEEKNIFWAEYIDRLVDIAYQKAKKNNAKIKIMAIIYRMKAEVLFRNFSDRKLHMVRYYLHMSCFFFDQMEDELEVLITYSKILRVRFAEMLQDEHQSLEFDYVLDTHFEYLEVMKGLEKYIKKQSDESPRIKKAIMQFVEFAKYYNLPLEGYDKFI